MNDFFILLSYKSVIRIRLFQILENDCQLIIQSLKDS